MVFIFLFLIGFWFIVQAEKNRGLTMTTFCQNPVSTFFLEIVPVRSRTLAMSTLNLSTSSRRARVEWLAMSS